MSEEVLDPVEAETPIVDSAKPADVGEYATRDPEADEPDDEDEDAEAVPV